MPDNARTAQELADELERKIGEYEVTCCIAGMNERAPMALEMERNAIKALVRRLAALASQAEPVAIHYVPIETRSHAEKNGRHPNDNEARDDLMRAEFSRMGDDRGQGLCTYWKWAFAAGWNAHKRAATPAPAQAERDSRAMFVARLERWEGPMTADSVLGLLNDCDMLAGRAAQAEQSEDGIRRGIKAALDGKPGDTWDDIVRRVLASAAPAEQSEDGRDAARWLDAVRSAEHLCPTDLPHMGKLRWKANHIRAAIAAKEQS